MAQTALFGHEEIIDVNLTNYGRLEFFTETTKRLKLL